VLRNPLTSSVLRRWTCILGHVPCAPVGSRLNAGGGGHAWDSSCTQSGDKQTTAHLCRLLCSKYLEEVSATAASPRGLARICIFHVNTPLTSWL
jgi:hypothetical protein